MKASKALDGRVFLFECHRSATSAGTRDANVEPQFSPQFGDPSIFTSSGGPEHAARRGATGRDAREKFVCVCTSMCVCVHARRHESALGARAARTSGSTSGRLDNVKTIDNRPAAHMIQVLLLLRLAARARIKRAASTTRK